MSLVDNAQDGASMAGMTPPRHVKTRTPGLGAAWAVLIGTGVTSVTYNVVHAVNGARLEIVLALLLGIAPAFLAAFLSHVAAVLEAPRWVIVSVIAVMGAGMVLSASATAVVVAPAEPGWRGWLFGGVLDAAALLALWAILTARRRNNQATGAAQTARAEVEAATARAGELAAELAIARAELEAERKRKPARKPQRSSARSSARKPQRSSAPEPGPAEVTTEARAITILAANPGINGTQLGAELGVTARYGRELLKRLAPAAPGGDSPG